jgi:hypothetical protein
VPCSRFEPDTCGIEVRNKINKYKEAIINSSEHNKKFSRNEKKNDKEIKLEL